MARLLVTVGTDGRTDWVRLPDGQKLSLGPVSVLNFLTSLAVTARGAKQALAGFLSGEEVLVAVDEGRMWDLLTPRRARWGSDDGSFMSSQGEPSRKNTMPLLKTLHELNQHVEAMSKFAGRVSPAKMAEGVAILKRLASQVQTEEPEAKAAEEQEPKDAEQDKGDKAEDKTAGLTIDTVLANRAVTQDILTKAETTVAKIDRLAAAGRRFNAAKAKADVHAVTSKVAEILQHTSMTETWVADDLQKLAKQADHLHGLFASAKV